MKDIQKVFFALIKGGITGEKNEIISGTEIDFDEIYEISRRHHIENIIYYGIKAMGLNITGAAEEKFMLRSFYYMRLSEVQKAEISAIFKVFDEKNFDYLPLKGTVLKDVYPKSDMRNMSDSDILIRSEQYEKIRPEMERLGYTEIVETEYELLWMKEGRLKLELHKYASPRYNKNYHDYFDNIWEIAEKCSDNANRYKIRPEDFMVIIFCHFARHYESGTMGVKHAIDFWVYKRENPDMDEKYLKEILTKLELYDFYVNVMKTVDAWFCGGKEDEVTEIITDRLFYNATFGMEDVLENARESKKLKNGEDAEDIRKKRVRGIIFPSFALMKEKYPVLEKLPFLLPVMWIVRGVEVLLFRRKSIRRFKAGPAAITAESISSYREKLKKVGLEFEFEKEE